MARIYKQPGSEKWYSDFHDPSHPKADKSGRVRIPLFTDQELSMQELGRLLGTKNADPARPPKSSSYLAFKERFLRHISTLDPVTIAQYGRAIKNLEDGAMFRINELQQITPAMFSELKTRWVHNGRGLFVRNRELQSLKAMMRVAESWGLIREQNWGSVKKDKEPKGRLLWWTMDQVKSQLYPGCPGIWAIPAKLSVRAGFRPGESYWHEWDNVDFDRQRLHITHVYEGKRLLWAPKDHERRWVPMPPDLIEFLFNLRKKTKNRFLFHGEDRRPTLPSMCAYAGKLIRSAGLKGSLYTGRHTYGSHLASGGASPKYIKEVMGHSKLEMTDRYMHLAPEVQQQGISSYLPHA